MNENIIVRLEKEGIVTATFRKQSPDKKTRLYRVCLDAFGRDIFDRISFDTLADLAGISKGSLFQYFTNKGNLLKFVFEIFADEYSEYWNQYFSREQPARTEEQIRSYFSEQLDQWQGAKREYNFYMKMLYENSRDLTRDFIRGIASVEKKHLSAIIRRGSKTAEIRQDVEVERITSVLTAIAESIFKYLPPEVLSLKKRNYIEQQIDSALKLVFDGIRG